MPNPFDDFDTSSWSRDLDELGKAKKKKKEGPVSGPPDLAPHNEPQPKKSDTDLPWLYDLEPGWTPRLAKRKPRPPLKLPPHYLHSFRFRTAGLANAKRTFLMIDLRPFPHEARVFVLLPTSIIRPRRLSALQQGTARSLDGVFARVPKKPRHYNRLFGENRESSVTEDTVLAELWPRKRAILDLLQLTPESVSIDIRYAVLREYIRPKTQYMVHLAQFADGFPVGEFEHLFQAYHPYDIPIVGDKRTMVAYRRTSRAVTRIPPLALEFFDSWRTAAAYGFNPAPSSFGKHFKRQDVTRATGERLLKFFNDPKLTVDDVLRKVQDNPYVDCAGKIEKRAHKKLGVRRDTAEAILRTRDGLGDGKFKSVEQIDSVKGVGPDTMSDIITSFLGVGELDDTRWHPSNEIEALLRPRDGRK